MNILKTIAAAVLALSAGTASAATFGGEFFDTNRSFSNIGDAVALANSTTPTATFQSTAIDYPNGAARTVHDDTRLSTFLGTDAASIVGDGSRSLWQSVFRFTGWLSLAGQHKFTVGSDDGFQLKIGDQIVASQSEPRGFGYTSALFDAGTGVKPFELVYYENRYNTGVEFKIDDALAAPSAVPLPAGLPLVLTGLAALGLAARRRKS